MQVVRKKLAGRAHIGPAEISKGHSSAAFQPISRDVDGVPMDLEHFFEALLHGCRPVYLPNGALGQAEDQLLHELREGAASSRAISCNAGSANSTA